MKINLFRTATILGFLNLNILLFSVHAEVANSSGQRTAEIGTSRPSTPTNRPETTSTNIDLVQINQMCQLANEKPYCIMGGTIGFQYVRNTNRLRQVSEISDIEELKKNAFKFCETGEGNDSFILESSKKSKPRGAVSADFINACKKIVELEIEKLISELNLN